MERKNITSYQKDGFASLHPAVQFLYFMTVISFAMFFRHLIFLLLSFLGASLYLWYLKRKAAAAFLGHLAFPVIVLFTVFNPLFSHEGSTILLYFPNGNPLTEESIWFGLHSGIMLGCVLIWCSCIYEIFTSDKLMGLFGSYAPSFTLLISMVFRFIPKCYGQFKRIREVWNAAPQGKRQGKRQGKGQGKRKGQITRNFQIVSIVTTWALETSVETAESMRARGYGIGRRRQFQKVFWEQRDTFFCILFLIGAGIELWAIAEKKIFMTYYPVLRMNEMSPGAGIFYGIETVLCLIPFLMGIWEELRWHYWKSGI